MNHLVLLHNTNAKKRKMIQVDFYRTEMRHLEVFCGVDSKEIDGYRSVGLFEDKGL